jgi:RNA polymerase sigma factor (sigma-70 family)
MANVRSEIVLRHIHRLAGRHSREQTDRQLLERFLTHREEAAFEALVERHGPLVLRVCRRVLRDAHAAEDAFQATFLVLARKAASISNIDLLANWLYGVAYRVAVHAKVDIAKRHNREAGTPSRPSADPVTEAAAHELCAVVEEELNQLKDRYRAPLLLCYFDGKTGDQAARQIGVSLRTLQRRLEHGRELLRKRLTRRGFTLSAALLIPSLINDASAALMPPTLTATTVQAALSLTVTGAGAALLATTRAIDWANGVVRAMLMAKLKLGTSFVLAALFMIAGASILVRDGGAPEPPEVVAAVESQRPKSAERKLAATDLYGDPLPTGAVARLGSLRFYHRKHLERVTLSPDGKLVASTAREDGNRLWDASTGRELPLRQELRKAVFFAAGGKLLAVQKEHKLLRLWDAADCMEMGQLLKVDSNSFGLSPDGKTIVVWSAETDLRLALRFCDISTGQVGDPIYFNRGEQFKRFAFSADGTILVMTFDNHTIRIWDVRSRTDLSASAPGKAEHSGNSIALTPDGKVLATTSSNCIPTVGCSWLKGTPASSESARQNCRVASVLTRWQAGGCNLPRTTGVLVGRDHPQAGPSVSGKGFPGIYRDFLA